MNKQNQKHIDRATLQGRESTLKTLAILHRCSTTRTQREIEDIIHLLGAGAEYSWVNGAILCQRQRDVIVGFPAHGNRHRRIDIRLATV